ncbi:hypothetical protein ACWT_1359 [Actinoplanes sp. SE50]|uniref:hypothetical protein n=1 Tax=unclassified Actinoplanes TaxID=2626549 RepID=UPI00023EBE97|nr:MULTISPECIES: hypothetical protein [unclassified Actinoplanes]AEV82377.1 hypothetical protein ACPL_1480 [Actinoplanes sp. SE50/110]ATO80774.1 hypothetical protein ACWT_1359 [Actinoplanes sp. SE50]SLL98182.1 hypothetical protein ACSP50_1406 [Actinoplanes sp. SE50/110]
MSQSDDYRLRDARRFVQNLEDALARTPHGRPVPGLAAIEGTDPTGTVHCRVGLRGDLRVAIVDGWWHSVGPDRIADAVLEAYRFACEKAGFARLVLRHHGRAGRAKSPPVDPGRRCSYPSGHADHQDLAELRRRLEQASIGLDRAARLSELLSGRTSREVTGPRRLFTVVMRGAVIQGARVAVHGLRRADGAVLAADAQDALLTSRLGITPGER